MGDGILYGNNGCNFSLGKGKPELRVPAYYMMEAVKNIDDLRRVCAELSGEDFYFESVHISLFKQDAGEFFDRVWGNFLKHHEEFFKQFFAGLTPYCSNRWGKDKSTRQERIQERKGLDLKKAFLFADNDFFLRIRYCSFCRNFQIINRFYKAVNECWYCKEYGYGQGNHKNDLRRDKQFFANLALLNRPVGEIKSKPPRGPKKVRSLKPKKKRGRPKALRDTRRYAIPAGYQTPSAWSRAIGVSRQRVSQLIEGYRVAVLESHGHKYIKIGTQKPVPGGALYSPSNFLKLSMRVQNVLIKKGICTDKRVQSFLKRPHWKEELLRLKNIGEGSIASIEGIYSVSEGGM